MLPDDALYRIALKHIPHVGAVIARNLISYCGSPERVFKTSVRRLLRIPGVGTTIASHIRDPRVLKMAEEELKLIADRGIEVCFFIDDAYPARLKGLAQSPVLLYKRGNVDLNSRRIVAIVGTRSPTHYGRGACEQIIEQLAPFGPLIVSGLAFGIDITAHRHALKQGLPTVGVMGHGFGHIYPAQHRNTANAMLENGGLITEFSYATKPDRENFPARNRIVAGLADVVIVIESGESGGSMITAEFANAFNREVAAVPGRSIDERSAGCNKLIRHHKAHLVEFGRDVIELMGWEDDETSHARQTQMFTELSDSERLIFELLEPSVESGIDSLAIKSKMPASQLATVLLSLELKGVVRAIPGKRYIKIG